MLKKCYTSSTSTACKCLSIAAIALSFLLASLSYAQSSDKIYMQVDRAEDFVILYVNGLERKRWVRSEVFRSLADFGYYLSDHDFGTKIDITEYFFVGLNEVRVVSAADTWSSVEGRTDYTLWKNNDEIASEQLFFYDSVSPFGAVFKEETVIVNMPGAPLSRQISVTSSSTGAAIYINDRFTGEYSPATFAVAPGEYKVGLGVYRDSFGNITDEPVWNDFILQGTPPNEQAVQVAVPPVNGEFFEQTFNVTTSHVTANISTMPLVTPGNSVKVGVRFYDEVHWNLSQSQAMAKTSATSNSIGILSNDDITVALAGINMAAEKLKDLAYGLADWDITVLPVVTTPVYYGSTESAYKTILHNAPMMPNVEEYDIIIHVMADYRQYGDPNQVRSEVDGHVNTAWGDSPNIYLPLSWVAPEKSYYSETVSDRLSSLLPSSGLIHESLHIYDLRRLTDFNGTEQTHGGEEHGYEESLGQCREDWFCFYEPYITSRIVENAYTVSDGGAVIPGGIQSPFDASTFVGVFDVIRSNMNESAPPVNIANLINHSSGKCMSIPDSDPRNGTKVTLTSCASSAPSLNWALKHIDGNQYNLLNKATANCVDFSWRSSWSRYLQQNGTCGSEPDKVLVPVGPPYSFQIKTLDDRCATAQPDNTVKLATCASSYDANQWWGFF